MAKGEQRSSPAGKAKQVLVQRMARPGASTDAGELAPGVARRFAIVFGGRRCCQEEQQVAALRQGGAAVAG